MPDKEPEFAVEPHYVPLPVLKERTDLPEGMHGLAIAQHTRIRNLISTVIGDLELAWRRGHHEGYDDGYADCLQGKPNRWTQGTIQGEQPTTEAAQQQESGDAG